MINNLCHMIDMYRGVGINKSEIKVPWTAMEIHKFQHPQNMPNQHSQNMPNTQNLI